MRIEDFDHLHKIYYDLSTANHQSKLSDKEKRESGIRYFFSDKQRHTLMMDFKKEILYLNEKREKDIMRFFGIESHCKEDLVLEFKKDITVENIISILIFYIELKKINKHPYTICCHFPAEEYIVDNQKSTPILKCDHRKYFFWMLKSIDMVYNLNEIGYIKYI